MPATGPNDLEPPRVSDLRLQVDSTVVSQPDSTAEIVLSIVVRAVDPDGTIDRTVFALEPASSPRRTAFGRLAPVEGAFYGRRLRLTVPLVREQYTTRVFAFDSDSLASNQVTGQFQFIPEEGARVTKSRAVGGEAVPRSYESRGGFAFSPRFSRDRP